MQSQNFEWPRERSLRAVCTLIVMQVAYARGWGTITGPNEVTVKKDDGTTETISTKNIVIATGSDVAPLPGVEVRSVAL